MRNIFVGNLSFNLTEEELAAFAQYGTVKHVNIVKDRDAGLPRGFAFVETCEVNDAHKAIVAVERATLDVHAAGGVPKLVGRWIDAHVPTVQIEEITTLATTVLEDADKAETWLSLPNPATDDRAPIELIGEPQGFERVKNLLLRIEYGVLA